MPKNKNCYLTDRGLQLLESALKELPKDDNCFKKCKKTFPKNVNFSKLAKIADIKRHETISNILNRSKGVNKSNIEKVFVAVDILEIKEDYYEDRDYETSRNLEDEDYIEKKRENEKTIADTNKSREAIATPDQVLVLPVGRIPCFIRNI